MEDRFRKLNLAQDLIINELKEYILSYERSEIKPVLKFTLKNSITVYIRFNNHKQYSYSIIFSKFILDRIRFDNYDEDWSVDSRPHHLHPHNIEDGIESPMNGDPEVDIPILIDLLRTIFKKSELNR